MHECTCIPVRTSKGTGVHISVHGRNYPIINITERKQEKKYIYISNNDTNKFGDSY